MTNLMQRALQAIERLPADQQHDIARYLLSMAGAVEPPFFSNEEWAAIKEAEAGEVVSEGEMQAFWSHHSLEKQPFRLR